MNLKRVVLIVFHRRRPAGFLKKMYFHVRGLVEEIQYVTAACTLRAERWATDNLFPLISIGMLEKWRSSAERSGPRRFCGKVFPDTSHHIIDSGFKLQNFHILRMFSYVSPIIDDVFTVRFIGIGFIWNYFLRELYYHFTFINLRCMLKA